MALEMIKDSHNKAIGYLSEDRNDISIFRMNGTKLGYFHKATGTTHKMDGSVISRSNILVSLLYR